MAEFREDPIFAVMAQLAACAAEELVKSGLDEIDKVMLQPGALPVLDWVGNPGQGCGEIIVYNPTSFAIDAVTGFPNQDTSGTCTSEYANVLSLGIFRCALQPKTNAQGKVIANVTPAEQTNATRIHTADKAAMRRAIACCLQGNYEYVVQPWQPYGPDGNAVGGIWTVIVGGAI